MQLIENKEVLKESGLYGSPAIFNDFVLDVIRKAATAVQENKAAPA